MQEGRVAFACAVLAAVVGLAGVVAAVRHDEAIVVATTQGELPELPSTGVLPPTPTPEVPTPERQEPVKPPEPEQPGALSGVVDGSPPTAATPQPPPPGVAADDPMLAVPPPGTLRGTARTPQPATKPTFDRAAYDLTAELQPNGTSARGWAGAERVSPTVWRITVVAEQLARDARHSILVTRPEPSHGTPGPTPCEFVSTAEGWGTCTGELWVAEGGQPQGAALFAGSGKPVATGGFA